MKNVICRLALALVALLAAGAAPAQGWKPERSVELTIPTSPGGSNDIAGRIVQKLWTDLKLLPVPSSVVNRGGGEYIVAYTFVQQRTGDAHQIGMMSTPMLVNPIEGRTPLTHRDVTPIAYLITELLTGRPPAAHFHSWTHYFWQSQEMWPDLFCQIHPDKAARLGIADGERVRVETAHGAIEAVAWLHAGIRPSAVFIPIGWGERQPFHPWRPVNFLTDKTQRDPVSDQTNLKVLLCRVARAA